MEGEENRTGDDSLGLDDLDKHRLDYATKWFQYHAGQRLSMFYYFLITVGILTNAYALLVRDGLTVAAVSIAVVGMAICAVFWALDTRNRQLTHFAEGVLRKIERDKLFADYTDTRDGKTIPLGMLSREEKEPVCWALKHRFLIRCTQIVLGVAFLGAALYGLLHGGPTVAAKVTVENHENNSVTITPVKP